MTFQLEALPDDPALLQDLVRELVAALREKDRNIEQLKHRLEQMLRHRFGRKSEQIDPGQMSLFLEQITAALNAPQAPVVETPEAPVPAPEKKGHGRNPLPKHLPRRNEEHPLPEEQQVCKSCSERLEKIGEEVTEQLDYIPASFFVRRHVRMKYACKNCQGNVVIAEMPAQPIEKGLPGPGLLAHVATSKYADHLPLYRLEGIFGRNGLEISRSTMCDWMGRCADLLEPVYKGMKAEVLSSKMLHTDDTPVPVRDETRKETRTGRLWTYVGDIEHPHILYDYTPDRCRDGPVKFLGNYRGYLQADAYAGYDAIFALGRVKEVACWAHARRKFFESKDADPQRAHLALAYVRQLYEVEALAKELEPAERLKLRQEKSRPVLAAFRSWLMEQGLAVLPKSPMGNAIGYAMGQWNALVRYLEDPDLAIDNNAAERALRRVAIGRKNWLFAGSDEGGRWAAILYSLVASCQRAGIDPFVYLRDVIGRISTHPARGIKELFPVNWKPGTDSPAPLA